MWYLNCQSGWTAPMTACQKGDFETVKQLGANPNLKSKVCFSGSSNLVAYMHNVHHRGIGSLWISFLHRLGGFHSCMLPRMVLPGSFTGYWKVVPILTSRIRYCVWLLQYLLFIYFRVENALCTSMWSFHLCCYTSCWTCCLWHTEAEKTAIISLP